MQLYMNDKKEKRLEQLRKAQAKYQAKKKGMMEKNSDDEPKCNHMDLHDAIKDLKMSLADDINELHKKFNVLITKIEDNDVVSDTEEEEEETPPKPKKKPKVVEMSDTEEEEEETPPKPKKKPKVVEMSDTEEEEEETPPKPKKKPKVVENAFVLPMFV